MNKKRIAIAVLLTSPNQLKSLFSSTQAWNPFSLCCRDCVLRVSKNIDFVSDKNLPRLHSMTESLKNS